MQYTCFLTTVCNIRLHPLVGEKMKCPINIHRILPFHKIDIVIKETTPTKHSMRTFISTINQILWKPLPRPRLIPISFCNAQTNCVGRINTSAVVRQEQNSYRCDITRSTQLYSLYSLSSLSCYILTLPDTFWQILIHDIWKLCLNPLCLNPLALNI